MAGMSASHFSQLFRQSMGLSPYRYVLTVRIDKAKRLLRGSRLGVLDVALATGFADQSHFAKTFRRVTGTIPTVYRARLTAGRPLLQTAPQESVRTDAPPEDQTDRRAAPAYRGGQARWGAEEEKGFAP
jgi:AraC-like DNA-binding protein